MRNLLTLIIALMLSTAVVAQDGIPGANMVEKATSIIPDGWWHNNLSGFTINHIGLKNWSAGGDPSFSFLVNNGYLGGFKGGKHLWQNTLFADYGVTLVKGQKVVKGCDRLAFSTKYGFQIDKEGKWYLSPYFGFTSQFSKSFDFAKQADVDADLSGLLQLNDKLGVLSKMGSPMILELSLGIDYVPNNKFSLYMSPAAVKFIIVANDAIALLNIHGNEGKNVNTQFGALMVATYQQQVHEKVGIRSILKLYKNYLDGPVQNIDINWETNVNLQVTKFIAANVFVNMIYDYDMDTNSELPGTQRAVQIKEIIGVGFTYNFITKITN